MKEVTEAIVEQETTSKTQGEVPEKVIKISRVAKVVKGGKNFSFSAVVVAGDGKGNVGIGLGKSNEVVDAIRKGALQAKKNAVKIKVKGDTIPHEAFGKYKASKVKLMPAGAGTGVIAGGPIRALCDAAGIKNILTKCLGSRNPINVARAAMDGFKKLRFERRK
ncbi:MAG: 30S ribosomal protein S5 [Candidatus Omnitrophica bacterium]|nr:30S ribosomal protein S5 [Candidatus Omnitrophota bacterium]